jgi:hypothetical protein
MDIAEHSVDHSVLLEPISSTYDHRDEILYIEYHRAMANDIESTRWDYIRHIVLSSVLDASIDTIQDLSVKKKQEHLFEWIHIHIVNIIRDLFHVYLNIVDTFSY